MSKITREQMVVDDLSALDRATRDCEPVTPDPDFALPADEHIVELGGGFWFLGTNRALAVLRAARAGKGSDDAEH